MALCHEWCATGGRQTASWVMKWAQGSCLTKVTAFNLRGTCKTLQDAAVDRGLSLLWGPTTWLWRKNEGVQKHSCTAHIMFYCTKQTMRGEYSRMHSVQHLPVKVDNGSGICGILGKYHFVHLPLAFTQNSWSPQKGHFEKFPMGFQKPN